PNYSVSLDVALECLGFLWELHRIYLFKSKTLSQLLISAVEPMNINDLESQHKSKKGILSMSCVAKYSGMCTVNTISQVSYEIFMYIQTCFLAEGKHNKQSNLAAQKTKALGKEKSKMKKITISLDVQDPEVTRIAFAIALKNLYSTEPEVEEGDVLGVLAAASVLQFPSLFQKPVLTTRWYPGFIHFFLFSLLVFLNQYKQETLVTDCERWLEVNLVPQLSSQIHLRKLPQELLQKVLRSPRLFTFNEFHLLKTTLCWTYLQLNPRVQIIPSHETILMYFSSLPKRCSFLEREAGQRYITVFQSLRLHGITSSKFIVGSLINKWHYHYIAYFRFLTDLDVMSFQRVKQTDPALSFFTAERSPVSLRQEREVKYEIKAQCLMDGKWREFSTDQLTQKFGVTKPSCKSQVLKARIPSIPVYVTYALLFPSS
ncbi:BTB/POZ domain-containing protein 16, partial [Chrysemys picta bellii]|uniref:BTB/POZ domain-containing protein 16 n=1 Tax=Chrysemys picta bellii TaxID=8478 RepID=UPI0032B20AD6